MKKTVKSTVKKILKKEPRIAARAPKKQAPRAAAGNIKKQYLKSGGECKVTFSLPRDAAPDARKITVVGDFNNWDMKATPMKKLKNGNFTATLKLDAGKDYRFRYLIDGKKWENDWAADRYEPNPYFCDDSVVAL
jgi:1,4-alpha-glucan branching enzyme